MAFDQVTWGKYNNGDVAMHDFIHLCYNRIANFMRFSPSPSSKRGFTLIESLVGIAVFMIIAVSVYQAYNATIYAVRAPRFKVIATALANEQFEIIRNLPYGDVGVVSGVPSGKVPHLQNL